MDGRRVLERVVATVGVAGLMAALPIYVSSGLVAPLWAIVLLLLFWGILVATAVRWFTRHPWLVLLLPAAAAVMLWLTLVLGEQLLGWQA